MKEWSGSWRELARGVLEPGEVYPQPEDLMRRLIEVGVSAVAERRAGPFAAAVATERGEVISIAVNQVAQDADSTAHAEMLALRQVGRFPRSGDLERDPGIGLQLYTSCQPCVMCMGAIHWSRIKRIYAAARHEDAMRFGIGPDLVADASQLLHGSGIEYVRDLLREESLRIFRAYARMNEERS
jgi:tRNA(Arg) A34 adenosine deaminase TadA